MKNKIFLICLLLTGCATTPVETVTKVERVVVKPPAELLTIPAPIIPIDIDLATQRTVANWIIKSEERTMRLEQQIKSIKKWSDEVHE